MAQVEFFSQDIPFKISQPRKISTWIKDVIRRERKELVHVNYIFCTDGYLLKLNQHYLNHNTFTDIITFDNSDKPGTIEGDIFISIERVQANAEGLGVSLEEELSRVLVHGILHLSGYRDKTASEKSLMRKKEDAYLSLRP